MFHLCCHYIFEEFLKVGILQEYFLPVVTAAGYMVKAIF